MLREESRTRISKLPSPNMAMTSSISGSDEISALRSNAVVSTLTSQRLTTTLDPKTAIHFLRGTPAATVLAGFGQMFRAQTPGGIGYSSKDGDLEYDKSVPVEAIDVFLSHSWQAVWLPKYLILLLYLNIVPAILASVFVTFSIWASRVYMDNAVTKQLTEECWIHKEVWPSIEFIGIATFFFVLLTWHNVALHRSQDEAYLFVDRICIHQTDMDLKALGIRSIGAILSNSKMLLVAWDRTYLERLWCVFELSAYFHSHPSGRIVILPNALGLSVTVQLLTTIMGTQILSRIRESTHGAIEGNTFEGRLAVDLVQVLVPALIVMHFIWRYLDEIAALDWQVSNFSASKAKCFCCSVNHAHPETGVNIPCDREQIYASIQYWYGHGHEIEGLRNFDALVNGRLGKEIKRSLSRVGVPYTHAIAVGLPQFFRTMAYKTECPLYAQVSRKLSFLLIRGPLLVFFLMKAATLCKRWSRTCRGNWRKRVAAGVAAACLGSLVFYLYEVIRDFQFVRRSWQVMLVWYIVEVLIGSIIWHPRLQASLWSACKASPSSISTNIQMAESSIASTTHDKT